LANSTRIENEREHPSRRLAGVGRHNDREVGRASSSTRRVTCHRPRVPMDIEIERRVFVEVVGRN
jgi:hypothetical protein